MTDLPGLPLDDLLLREWIVTNRIGAFASSTIPGCNTRKYHGLLVAAMTPPVRRMVLLSRVEETVFCGGRSFATACNEYPGTVAPQGHKLLADFRHEPSPRWVYRGDGWTLEKRLDLLENENTVCLSYRLLEGAQIDLELRPLFALRGMHELMYQWNGRLEDSAKPVAGSKQLNRGRIPATSRTPEVFFAWDSGRFEPQGLWYFANIYRREQQRGYSGLEDLWTPGLVHAHLAAGESVRFVCSNEPIELPRVLAQVDRGASDVPAVPPIAVGTSDSTLERMMRAAGQFLVQVPDGHKGAHEPATGVMAAWPWAAPSARDAMICLPGLLLVNGAIKRAGGMLRVFAGLLKDGLLPGELAEDSGGWQYTAADTALWFANAVWHYHRYGGDCRHLLPALDAIVGAYHSGPTPGVCMDEEGLLEIEDTRHPATWMDARYWDEAITPRHGRPVELNALWYNALRITAELHRFHGNGARGEQLSRLAGCVQEAFNRRFWNDDTGCCFDVVGEGAGDPAIRPNQLFAVSLPFAVLDPQFHWAVVEKIRRELLTPMGLRTLAPDDPDYQGRYTGPPRQRDLAHHNGSAFPWLLGPLVSAVMRIRGRGEAARQEARRLLDGPLAYLSGQGMGQICELFDGDAPHAPGGAIASARSVAEVLRCYVEDVLDQAPAARAIPGAVSRPAAQPGVRSPGAEG